MINKKVNIDLSSSTSPIIATIQQWDDKSRTLEISLYDNGSSYIIPTSALIIMQLDKPDGTTILESSEGELINIRDNKIYITLSAQMTIVDGIAKAKISIVEQNFTLYTTLFKLQIEGGLISEEKIISTDEFNALTQLLEKATTSYDYVIKKTKENADNAKASADKAKASETNAKTSETNAKTSETNAKASETNAKSSETNTKKYSENAKTSETNAGESVKKAKASEDNAKISEGKAKTSEDNAKASADKAKEIAIGLSGALLPMGTISFENLPNVAEAAKGAMYNIDNEFTTTDAFVEGKGHLIPKGANVYKTVNDKWDVLSGTTVVGIKGNAESKYRVGNVNITASNLGFEIESNTEPTTQTNGDYWILPYEVEV